MMILILTIALIFCIIIIILSFRYYYKKFKIKKEDANKEFYLATLHPFVELFTKNTILLYFLVSILLFLSAKYSFKTIKIFESFEINSDEIASILNTTGTIIITSAVISSITRSKHFLKIYNEQIKEIIFSEDFIRKQKDVDKIWNAATKALCAEHFEVISEKLFDSIKKDYLPSDQNFYYQDFQIDIKIEIDKSDDNYIIITERTKTTLICRDAKKENYQFNSNIFFDPQKQLETSYQLKQFKVDGKQIDAKDYDLSSEIKGDFLCTEFKHTLQGQRKYEIEKTEIKKYNYILNPNRIHTAQRIFNNFSIDVHYPKELIIRFIKLGVSNDWNVNFNKDEYNGIYWYRHKVQGIMFKNQGFMLNYIKNT